MLKIAVFTIDDTYKHNLIHRIYQYYNIVDINIKIDCYKDYNIFIDAANTCNYSYLIFDISLNDTSILNIRSIFRKLIKINKPVVFFIHDDIKNISVFTINSFEKNIEKIKIDEVNKFIINLSKFTININENDYNQEIIIKTSIGYAKIEPSKIIYIEYINRKIIMITENKRYYINDTIKNILSRLDTNLFISPHCAYIVNIKKVKEINKEKHLIMTNNVEIPISKLRYKETKNMFVNSL